MSKAYFMIAAQNPVFLYMKTIFKKTHFPKIYFHENQFSKNRY